MDIRQELAKTLSDLSGNHGVEEILLILDDYTIQKKSETVSADMETRVGHFLSAKRVDGLSEKTLHNYRIYLTKFSSYVRKDVNSVNTDDIRGYLSSLKLKDSSLMTVINTLRSFFVWLCIEEIIVKNPMLKIKTLKQRRKHMRKSLSLEELERLRTACVSIREKALVEFFYSTGCRLSEVAGIRISDVNFAQRSVMVIGKGDKERIVYFSIKAKLFLEEYLRQRPGGLMLFAITRAPYTGIHTRSIQNIIRELGERAALPERIFPHILRHTFATLALNNGMDITIIQKLLGHAQLSTTEVYATISLENVRHAYDRIVC